MDKVSQVLAQGVPPGVRISYRALADGKVAPSNLYHRARGRRLMEEKAQSQQYSLGRDRPHQVPLTDVRYG